MDNAQKAIMIGVGLFITIIIISAVMLITQAGSDLMDQGLDQLGNISESLRIQVTEQYDGKVLTGSQVRAACSELIGKTGVAVTIGGTAYTDYDSARSAITSTTQKYETVVTYDDASGIATVEFTAK